MRIVSLLPAATEILYALGHEPVGVSSECDHPPAAEDRPAINRCRIDTAGSSAGIDRRVARANEGDGVYAIDRDALAAADPDLIVTQGVCEVCAVDRIQVETAVDDLGLDTAILTMDPHSLDDVLAAIDRIGRAIGAADRAEAVIAGLERRIEAVRDRVRRIDGRPRVTVLDWMDPPMVAGHWIPGMVDLLGGRWGITDPGGRSRPGVWEGVIAFDPEVLVVAPCGLGLEQTVANLDELRGKDGWSSIDAVRNGRAYVMDGNRFVNRPGPRLVDTLEHLGGAIHPSWFPSPPESVVRSVERAATTDRYRR